MSNLITLDNISLAFGLEPLLDKAKLQISSSERICLIGRNGAGKSSFLKIISGDIIADSGNIWRKPELRIARLEQELPQNLSLTVYEYVAQGLAHIGALLAEYHLLLQTPLDDENTLKKLANIQHDIDSANGWQLDQKIQAILTRLQLPCDKPISALSGGWQRRAALAKALVADPELLLLDEPTNHLDIEAIQWLENFLLSSNIGLIFITHDRALLQRLATRIIELDRGQLTSWPGDYANFLRRKEELLNAEASLNNEFDKKLAQEERWVRQGIKARRTRNEGRVRALESLRLERSQRREVEGKVSFSLNDVNPSGKLAITAEHISHRYNVPIIDDFSIRVMRGDKIGLVGPNGVGKSTLLNILLGQITPQQGTVNHGTQLQIAYFDQLRAALDLEKTVIENVNSGNDTIEINGKSKHIISYLNDFLFTPERARTPVKALSGGECNRLLLARLFSKPTNLIVLDEPTNDLDIETLELLEELLMDYTGTLLIVSHDRAFLDNVVTSTLVFSGGGKITEVVGGYQATLVAQEQNKKAQLAEKTSKPPAAATEKTKTKLSYKEQQELASLPKLIEALEQEQSELNQFMIDPNFYQQDKAKIDAILKRQTELEALLANAYQRWGILDS